MAKKALLIYGKTPLLIYGKKPIFIYGKKIDLCIVFADRSEGGDGEGVLWLRGFLGVLYRQRPRTPF